MAVPGVASSVGVALGLLACLGGMSSLTAVLAGRTTAVHIGQISVAYYLGLFSMKFML